MQSLRSGASRKNPIDLAVEVVASPEDKISKTSSMESKNPFPLAAINSCINTVSA